MLLRANLPHFWLQITTYTAAPMAVTTVMSWWLKHNPQIQKQSILLSLWFYCLVICSLCCFLAHFIFSLCDYNSFAHWPMNHVTISASVVYFLSILGQEIPHLHLWLVLDFYVWVHSQLVWFGSHKLTCLFGLVCLGCLQKAVNRHVRSSYSYEK